MYIPEIFLLMLSQWRAAGTPSYSVTQLQENIFTFRGTFTDISSSGVVHLQKLTCTPGIFVHIARMNDNF